MSNGSLEKAARHPNKCGDIFRMESSDGLARGAEMSIIQKTLSLAVFAVLLMASAGFAQEQVPAGTIIPVMLNSTLSSQKAKPGQAISGRVMQDVPLPNGMKIRERTRITGHVVEVRQGSAGNPTQISFVFDGLRLSKASVPIKTDLRALAGMMAVESAQLPLRGMGEGDSWNDRTTVQVGGDTAYWGGGPLVGTMGIVGKPVTGTDTAVLGKVLANPEGQCRGEIEGRQSPQALWVFSADACGVYGIDGVTIAHAGRTEPVGQIELSLTNDKLKIPSGSGMLLRVDGKQ